MQIVCEWNYRRNNSLWECWHCFCCWVTSVASDSVRPGRRQPTRLLRPWDSPGKNTLLSLKTSGYGAIETQWGWAHLCKWGKKFSEKDEGVPEKAGNFTLKACSKIVFDIENAKEANVDLERSVTTCQSIEKMPIPHHRLTTLDFFVITLQFSMFLIFYSILNKY